MYAENLTGQLQLPIFEIVGKEADRLEQDAYLIGGYVRDLLLNRPCTDIDFMTIGSGEALAKEVARAMNANSRLKIFKSFGTAHLNVNGNDYEFVGARKESYRSDSRNPIVENGTLEDDLSRRDFTINALAIQLNISHFGKLIDRFNGLEDMQNKCIRTPLDPDITFSDDPLRMMRAIRFAAQLNFTVEPEVLAAISRQKERIKIISKERISEELNKILASNFPSKGFILLSDTGLLELVFPEMEKLRGVKIIDGKGHKDNFFHTLQVVENVARDSDDLWLRWAAVLHDIAKPATQRFEPGHGWTFHGHEDLGARWVPKIFKRMALPLNEKMRFVQKLVRLHLRPIALVKDEITDTAIRRLLFDAGDDLEALMLLCRADITTKNPRKVERYLLNFERVWEKLQQVEEKDRIRNFQPPIDGLEIMNLFGLNPGPQIGQLKEAMKEAILEGEIPNEKSAAYNFMLIEAAKMGLTLKVNGD
jgi:poly(A) polymerase